MEKEEKIIEIFEMEIYLKAYKS
ncbi:hypothetical protein LCGC14_1331340, partial [marine sediment metagenome]